MKDRIDKVGNWYINPTYLSLLFYFIINNIKMEKQLFNNIMSWIKSSPCYRLKDKSAKILFYRSIKINGLLYNKQKDTFITYYSSWIFSYNYFKQIRTRIVLFRYEGSHTDDIIIDNYYSWWYWVTKVDFQDEQEKLEKRLDYIKDNTIAIDTIEKFIDIWKEQRRKYKEKLKNKKAGA